MVNTTVGLLFAINAIQAIGDFTATTVGGLDRDPTDQELQGGIIAYGFSNILTSVAMTTGDLPKIMVKPSGNWARAPLAWDTPTPRAADRPTMVVFRAVRLWEAMSFMPVMAMVEKTVMVAPPWPSSCC